MKCIAALALLLLSPIVFASATINEETIRHLDQLRAISPSGDKAATKAANQEMDAAWSYYKEHKAEVLPVLREQLEQELGKSKPSDLLLLDSGWFLYSNDGPEGKAMAKRALFALDTHAIIVRSNQDELFHFAYAVARDRDPRILEFIDRTFLTGDWSVAVPQHAMTLDSTQICAFLYGVYGVDAEQHLRTRLHDPHVAKRVIEVLIWTGSPASIPDVEAAYAASPDAEMFVRLTAFMMRAGGRAGRDFMLALDPEKLDPKSATYLAKVRGAIQSVSLEQFRAGFAHMTGDKKLSDSEVRSRLDAMLKNDGKDDRTNPGAILDSTLPAGFLIDQLVQIRSRMFRRLSNEALDDVQVTNLLMNGLSFRIK